MEQHRDEHIVCADCSASFVFSADEAAVFAERGLTAPKRCKECRRARKSRVEGGGRPSGGRPAPSGGSGDRFQEARGQGPRYGGSPRHYTGDVNEYRSPMQDSYAASYVMPVRGPSPRPSHGGPGEYRSPMPDGRFGGWRAPDGQRARGGGTGNAPSGPRSSDGNRGVTSFSQGRGPAPSKPPRSRPQGESFAITCSACGQSAEVPFKPAEGREVFCQTCYRARRAPV